MGRFGDDQRDVVVLFVGRELADVGHHVLQQRLAGLGTVAEERIDEARFAVFVLGLVERFGDAVGVEDERLAGVDGAFAQFAVPCFEDAEDGGGGLEAVDGIVAPQNERGRMAAIDIAEAAAGNVVVGEEKRGEGAVGRVLREELVDDAKNIFQAIVGDGALAAQIGLQVGHEQRGGDAFAGDVADDKPEAVRAEVEKIVVITAYGARRETVAGVVQRGNRRTELRKKAALYFVGDFEFLGGAAFEFEFCGSGSALGFKRVRDFVEADERERVAVGIAKARGDAAPDRRFLTEQRRFGGSCAANLTRFGIELDAAQARRVIEANSAVGPFLIFGEDVFGDKRQARGAADEFEVERVGLRCDQREDGLPVRRSYGDEAFTGLQFRVVREVEAELVDIEAQAAVLVAHVDIDGVDAEVGRGLRGWCGCGHGEIIRRGAGAEK
jgi:hypothetical protein